MKHIYYIPCLLLTLLTLLCCKDNESFTSDSSYQLSFSCDEVRFDTVISTVGSSTKQFSVYNNNKKGIRATSVYLESRGKSGFRINIDGQFGPVVTDVEVLREDSILCFVEITAPDKDSNEPVVVRDNIVFELESGVKQSLPVMAIGQDVFIVKDFVIKENFTFTAKRPYLILQDLVVDTLSEVTIEPGAILMLHANKNLKIYGRIIADGTIDKPIVIRGDRVDKIFPYLPYDRLDNQWGGIYIDSISSGNVFNYVDIHGGNNGIICSKADTLSLKLTLTNSIVHNIAGSGVYLNTCNTLIGNCQISNTLGNCVEIHGGNHVINYCTIAQFYPWKAERGLALYVSNNYAEHGGDVIYTPLESLCVTNSFITGYSDDEIMFSMCSANDAVPNPQFNPIFDFCALNTKVVPEITGFFTNCRFEDPSQPAYKSTNFVTMDNESFIYDFRLTSASIAHGAGSSQYNMGIFDKDRLGNPHPDENPDVGCYQIPR